MDFIRFADAPPYTPPGHEGVTNRLLAGIGAGGVPDVSVWHGDFVPGGESDVHIHETSVQIYVGLSGTFAVGDGTTEQDLGVGDAVIIPAGEPHCIANRTDGPATVLVISTPALR